MLQVLKRHASRALVLVPLLGAGVAAHAAVPAGAEAVFTTMATDFGTIAGYGFTLMAVVVGGLVIFKIVKKVFSKAT